RACLGCFPRSTPSPGGRRLPGGFWCKSAAAAPFGRRPKATRLPIQENRPPFAGPRHLVGVPGHFLVLVVGARKRRDVGGGHFDVVRAVAVSVAVGAQLGRHLA